MTESEDSAGRSAGGQDPWRSATPAASEAPPGWEREAILRLAGEALREQRRARRWGILFKSLTLGYLVALLLLVQFGDYGRETLESGPHVALVDLDGLIAPGEPAAADQVTDGLRAAFAHSDTKAVVLRINSPGGSPVQAGIIYQEIRRLREKHPERPLYAVIDDICASGGYYVAAAADKIYADPASIVGSIGVRMDAFGFVEAMNKLGVERRLLTAGENKALLDPFLPARPEQLSHLQALLDDIHAQFIERVKQGRGDRLAPDAELFSGLVWTGDQALAKGLVDGHGDARHVAREVVGVDRLKDFTPREDLLSRLADRIGAGATRVLLGTGWQWR